MIEKDNEIETENGINMENKIEGILIWLTKKKEKVIEVIAIKKRNRKIEKDLGRKNTRNKNKINIDLEMTNKNI